MPTVVIVYFAVAVFGVIGASLVVRLGLCSKAGRRLLKRKIKKSASALANSSVKSRSKTYPVHYATERGSHSFWRPIPWDATGTLSATPDALYFYGSSPFGQKLEMKFNPEESLINYQKGKFFDGGMSWCVIESNGERHYFSSDLSDPLAFKNIDPALLADTTKLYRDLTNRYIKGS